MDSWLTKYYEKGLLNRMGNEEDRYFAGVLLNDCFCRCRFDFGKGIDYGKLRVDVSFADKTPDNILYQRDRFYRAMMAVPLPCRKIIEDVICWDLPLQYYGRGERQKRDNFVAQVQNLCIGLDCLATHYRETIKNFR